MDHVSDVLADMLETMSKQRDNEISTASECLASYVTDHNDKAAYRRIDRQVNQLAKAWDKMLGKLAKWHVEARNIEGKAENFYGD